MTIFRQPNRRLLAKSSVSSKKREEACYFFVQLFLWKCFGENSKFNGKKQHVECECVRERERETQFLSLKQFDGY